MSRYKIATYFHSIELNLTKQEKKSYLKNICLLASKVLILLVFSVGKNDISATNFKLVN